MAVRNVRAGKHYDGIMVWRCLDLVVCQLCKMRYEEVADKKIDIGMSRVGLVVITIKVAVIVSFIMVVA